MTVVLTRPAPERSLMSESAPGLDVRAAFEEHGASLLGFAVNALRDHGLAEDCVQETFLRAWRSRALFDPGRGSPRTWLFAIERRVILDVHRARERTPRLVAEDDTAEAATEDADPLSGRRYRTSRSIRPLSLTAGAAACLVVGLGGGVFLASLRDATVEGPPGTLGALEEVDFAGEPAGVEVAGDVVAHTWGTETVLRVDGLPTGDSFSIVVTDDKGREHSSGTLLGPDVTIDCRLNAAVLRADVVTVEIRNDDGASIAVAEVPPVVA